MKKQKKNKKSFFKIGATKPISVLLKNFFVLWLIIMFFVVILVQQDYFLIKMSQTPQDVIFVLPGGPEDRGMDDIELGHGAATDWSFLFDNEKEDEKLFEPEKVDTVINSGDEFPFESENVFGGLADEINQLSTGITKPVVIEKKNCKTPRGENVVHGDFVLAYKQRKDVDNICDVQRRFCDDGKLKGTYTQESCKENTLYSYLRPEVISYTEKPTNPFVQPDKPSLSGAKFDVHGKIDGKTQSIDARGSVGPGKKPSTNSTNQVALSEKNCSTPRGEKVKDGQIIKAYKSSVGLIDLPCETEIRLCVGGQLKGSFTQKKCDFVQLTYSDYLKNNDSKTNKNELSGMYSGKNESKLKINYFWTWVGKYF